MVFGVQAIGGHSSQWQHVGTASTAASQDNQSGWAAPSPRRLQPMEFETAQVTHGEDVQELFTDFQ